ncbi:MAG: family lipolytic protein, partial [Planctomycetaceae bacterium]|nr:family lipolytic protein [Planctomycetaceae bacterium]
LVSTVSATDPIKPVALKQGDHIIFLGDSITAYADAPYSWVGTVRAKITKTHPDFGLRVLNAGVSGNTVTDLQVRLETDVLSKKPTVVFIYIGINDVWKNSTTEEKYESTLKEITSKLKSAGARVIIASPSVVGEKKDGANELDLKLDKYAALFRKVARDTGSQFCDIRKAFVDYIQANNEGNKESGLLTTDRVHVSPAGDKLLAEVALKALSE